jgi:hypothetical protein
MTPLKNKFAKISKGLSETRRALCRRDILSLIFPVSVGSYYLHIAIYVMVSVIVGSSLRTISISGQISVRMQVYGHRSLYFGFIIT